MKQVLIVTAFFPPALGGIEQTLARFAAAYGTRATVLTVPQAQAQHFDQRQAYAIVRRPFFTRWQYPHWLPLLRTIEAAALKIKAERILFGHYAPYAIVGRHIARQHGIPYAVYCHGLDALSYTRTAAHRWLLARILRQAAGVATNSDWTARQLQRYLPLEKTTTIYPPLPAAAEPLLPLPQSPSLISIGRWHPIKGFDVAIEAVARLKPLFPSLRYVIVGAGPEEQRYRALISHHRLEGSVILKRSEASDAWRTDMPGAQLFIQPSRSITHETFIQEESFGLGAIEAAAAGRPAVATHVGGVPEAVIEGETGQLVPPDDPIALADAIARLLTNRPLLEAMGKRAHERAIREFSPTRFLQRWASLIQEPADQPKVSICIPAYNTAATLGTCLQTLFAQTYQNLEWIVVDDGSTDATPAIATRDPRVRLIRGPHRGAAAARNLAAKHATGDLLYFSDADCRHEPDAIHTLVRALQCHPEANFAYASFRLGWKIFRLRPFDPWALRERNYISTRALIRRNAFPGFDESLKRLQDWDLWLTMSDQGSRGVWVDRVLYQQQTKGTRTMSGPWFPKFLYRFPAVADWLSRGAGLTLREAEAIVREKHPLTKPQVSADFVCPRCLTAIAQSFPTTCTTCRTAFLAQRGIPQLLHPELVDEFKRLESAAHNESLGTNAMPRRDRYYHRQAKARLRQLPSGSRLLEVAGGTRPDSFELARAGFAVTVTDIAADRVAKAQAAASQLGLPPIRFAVADAEHLPFNDHAFDAVLTAASFHHFPHPQRALHELRRVVRPGGLIVLELEPQRWPYRTLFRWLRPVRTAIRSRETGVHHSIGDDSTDGFTAPQLTALFRNEGLVLLELQPVKLLSEFADQTTRLVGKLTRRTWETPSLLITILTPIDRILERLPLVRRLAWHWNVVARVP